MSSSFAVVSAVFSRFNGEKHSRAFISNEEKNCGKTKYFLQFFVVASSVLSLKQNVYLVFILLRWIAEPSNRAHCIACFSCCFCSFSFCWRKMHTGNILRMFFYIQKKDVVTCIITLDSSIKWKKKIKTKVKKNRIYHNGSICWNSLLIDAQYRIHIKPVIEQQRTKKNMYKIHRESYDAYMNIIFCIKIHFKLTVIEFNGSFLFSQCLRFTQYSFSGFYFIFQIA